MICFVAYTGARRSEAMRSQLQDLDFENRVITIREKKRVRGRLSTRQVPMPEPLQIVLESWLADYPGTEFTFAEIKFGEESPSSISNDQASNFFQKAFAKSKWGFLPGWHVFRHSFCSNCAAAGIEQRVINQWVGHQTDEMVKRYRHCFPDRQNEQINRVFNAVA